MYKKGSYVISAAIVIAIAVVLFFPVMGNAGSLEPSAVPAPTMKTLDQIPPTWSQKLSCDITACPRFEVVLDGAAVLDKETGLVWESFAGKTEIIDLQTAIDTCVAKVVGGRQGWHLPTIEQLTSLSDIVFNYSFGAAPLPYFRSLHWSTSNYWSVDFSTGLPFPISGNYVWCVRGGQSHDVQ